MPRLLIAGRLAMPVVLLTALLGATYLYMDQPLGAPFSSAMLAMSDLVLPIAFFAINLTNRRYGADYAFAQLAAAMVLCVVVMLAHPRHLDIWLGTLPSQTASVMIALGIAFFTANLAGIAMFELARGPSWWLSPLVGSAITSLVFSLIYYPAALAGWSETVLTHAALFIAESVALLLPYQLLRTAMRPVNGLNGY